MQPFSQSCNVPTLTPPLTGSQKRLMDIEKALRLSGRLVTSQPTRTPGGRAKRIKDITEALSGKDVSSQTAQMNVSPTRDSNLSLKRRSCSSPEPSPNPKRRHIPSSSPDLSPLLSPTNSSIFSFEKFSGSPNTSEKSTPEPEYSNPGSEPDEPETRNPYALPSNVNSYLERFFERYPDFRFDPSSSATAQVHRMCDLYKWNPHGKERRAAFQGFKDALSQQFNHTYGTEVDDLRSWQKLCQVLRIKPIPQDLGTCQDAVLSTHVNIVDLVETPKTGKPIHVFSSEVELSDYTISHRKFFPRKNAYAGGLLRFLLRNIMNPKRY